MSIGQNLFWITQSQDKVDVTFPRLTTIPNIHVPRAPITCWTNSNSFPCNHDNIAWFRLREGAAAPENELKKTADGLSYSPTNEPMVLTEHEQRFRKSMDRLQSTAPDWYRDRLPPATNVSQATDHRSSGYGSRPYSRQQYDYNAYQPPAERQRQSSGSALNRPGDLGSPVGGISFPIGMFDKYKDEIEDLRRSRDTLHQVSRLPTQEHIRVCALWFDTTCTVLLQLSIRFVCFLSLSYCMPLLLYASRTVCLSYCMHYDFGIKFSLCVWFVNTFSSHIIVQMSS